MKRKEIYGCNSEELIAACKKVARTCHDLAQKFVNEGDLDSSFGCLKRGENITCHDPECLQMIYNSMASLYKHKGVLRMAHRYFMLALDLEDEIKCGNNQRKAQIQLNICAVTSQLGKHKTALKQAESAIEVMEQLLLPVLTGESEKDCDKSTVHFTEAEKSKSIATLVIAYYNAGVEQEHMLQFNLSHYCYQNGLKIASLNFYDDHDLVKTLKEASESVVKKIVHNNIHYENSLIVHNK